jgi:hypothetical protein
MGKISTLDAENLIVPKPKKLLTDLDKFEYVSELIDDTRDRLFNLMFMRLADYYSLDSSSTWEQDELRVWTIFHIGGIHALDKALGEASEDLHSRCQNIRQQNSN